MELVKKGLTSKQIARELHISHRTVEAHVAAVIETLQVNNRMAAVARLEERKHERETAQNRDAEGPSFLLRNPSFGPDTYLVDFADPPMKTDDRGPRILPPLGGQPNTASASARLAWITRIAALAIMLSCMVILAISGVSELATSID